MNTGTSSYGYKSRNSLSRNALTAQGCGSQAKAPVIAPPLGRGMVAHKGARVAKGRSQRAAAALHHAQSAEIAVAKRAAAFPGAAVGGGGVFHAVLLVTVVPAVLHPFKGVAAHVVKPPGVGLLLCYGVDAAATVISVPGYGAGVITAAVANRLARAAGVFPFGFRGQAPAATLRPGLVEPADVVLRVMPADINHGGLVAVAVGLHELFGEQIVTPGGAQPGLELAQRDGGFAKLEGSHAHGVLRAGCGTKGFFFWLTGGLRGRAAHEFIAGAPLFVGAGRHARAHEEAACGDVRHLDGGHRLGLSGSRAAQGQGAEDEKGGAQRGGHGRITFRPEGARATRLRRTCLR